ncbi:MAG: single-stranded-DNA-specific exonuclease RecJ [Candidatus Levybacteria bacterium RIFCSPHIGHO2_01_FULL_41_15]|nr:MAG: single-stranded-DNA-specific exonuclease RecJ [Candidatus Levybacteria bacterium RIFCSPHIGHO2_01_FULL_41_15]
MKSGSKKQRLEKITKILLENRGYKNKKEIKEFLNPDINKITPKSVGINQKELKRALSRINSAIKNKEQIAVFGDYDADGICATAILWETLNEMGADVMPYIPYRIDEGYGLSETGIKNLKLKIKNCSLIITVDNGIVANKAVDFANKKGIDVIITDHHVPSRKLPKAYSIIHTTKLCGGGVAWLLSQEILNSKFEILNKSQITNHKSQTNQHLELVVLATIADLVPLTFANRALVKCGLEELRKTKRIGLLALIQESQINKSAIDVYEVGHIIAPRLNAMGRIEYAMDSLRLLCTKDRNRAKTLAEKLASTNRRRQELTIEAFEHAKIKVKSQKSKVKSLIFIGHESYEQGVIGLVAGRLVEEFYRPSIVLSLGEKISKASARSINGFNIIEFIRGAGELLMDVGGHPMAAGFTVETSKIALLAQKFESMADKLLSDKSFQRDLRIDLEILFSDLNLNLTERLLLLSPFGVGNPKPTFLTRNLTISDMRLVGAENKHLSLKLSGDNSSFYAIGFGFGKRADEIKIGDAVDLVYTPEVDEWNGDKRIKLKVKDFKINSG